MRNRFALKSGILALALFVAGPALAHAKLIASEPAADATVAAPKGIKLTFNEKITAAFSGFDLSMAGSMKVPVTIAISDDGKTMTGTPQGSLMPGAYQLNWHAVAAGDGHRTEGSVAFKVK